MSKELINIRIVLWVIGMAIIGALLQTKTAFISPAEVIVGGAVVAVLGFIMGTLFSTLAKNKNKREE